jgi:hypothetical protein
MSTTEYTEIDALTRELLGDLPYEMKTELNRHVAKLDDILVQLVHMDDPVALFTRIKELDDVLQSMLLLLAVRYLRSTSLHVRKMSEELLRLLPTTAEQMGRPEI